MRQAVILAGGKGTRLRERLNGRPKTLVDFNGAPLLRRQIGALRASGISDIIILVNQAADQIEAFCADLAFADLRITLLNDGEPRGTAGALLYALNHLAERFLVIYGDTVFDIDLNRFWRAHATARPDATLFLHPNDHPFDSDLIEIDEDGCITAFHTPPHDAGAFLPNLANAAMYMLEREAIVFWRDERPPTDIARDLCPAMLRRGARMRGYVSVEYIKDIGTPKRLDKANDDLRSGVIERARRGRPKKAIFLDRDGTINELRGYIKHAEDFVLIDGVADAIKQLNDAEYRVVVVTNQPVIGRGETTFAEMRRIHNKMDTLLGQSGAFVDRLYLCPHHPDKGFASEVVALKMACNCRKPGTALVEKARDDLNIDVSQSWVIGDTTSDMLTARRAGLKSMLVETGEAGRDGKYAASPDFIARDLPAAVAFITHGYQLIVEAVVPVAQRVKSGDLVFIGGLARQGKSTLASVLRHTLSRAGLDVQILALDGFLRDREQRQPGVLGRYDLEAMRATLAPWLESGAPVDVDAPNYDRLARRQSPRKTTLRLAPQSVLIVEGVPALLLDLATRRAVTRVFVDGSEADRERRVVDDLMARGMCSVEAQSIYDARSVDETPIVAVSAARADFVLSLDVFLADPTLPDRPAPP